MIKGLIALAFGALSFGVVEFVAMGLMPYISQDFQVDMAQAGYTISAYAFGVCFGVVYMAFTRKLNLKVSICIVVTVHLIGIICTALATNFELLLAARFLSGMPHGCFFGLAAIISTRIAQAGKASTAMAIMIAGQTISNVFGVPLGTALAHTFSWKMIFYIMAIWALLVLFSIWKWLPNPGAMEDHGFKSQFAFLKHKAPYLVGLSILLGNGGIFCLQSYVSPILTDFVGLSLVLVPTVLIAMGIAMMIANLIAGRLSDIFTPGKVTSVIFILTILSMVLIFVAGNNLILGVSLMIFCSGMLFGLSTPQQISILRTAPGGELIGVAFGQIAFNFGNAVGAWLGGIPLDLGFNARYCILVAIVITIIGTLFMLVYTKKYEVLFTPAKTMHNLSKEAAQKAEINAEIDAKIDTKNKDETQDETQGKTNRESSTTPDQASLAK